MSDAGIGCTVGVKAAYAGKVLAVLLRASYGSAGKKSLKK
jgi:hypothetical protein